MGSRGRSGPHLPSGEPGPGESCQPVALGGSARVQTRPRTLILEPAPPEAPSRPTRPLTCPTSPCQPGGEGKQRGREDRGPARAGERLVATQQVFHPRDRVGVQGPELVTEGGVGDRGDRGQSITCAGCEFGDEADLVNPGSTSCYREVIFVMTDPGPVPLSWLKTPRCIPRKPALCPTATRPSLVWWLHPKASQSPPSEGEGVWRPVRETRRGIWGR